MCNSRLTKHSFLRRIPSIGQGQSRFVRIAIARMMIACVLLFTWFHVGDCISSNRTGTSDIRLHSGPKYTPINPDGVKVVHLIQSNHLDLGFSDYTSNVINRYFTGEWGTAAPPAPRTKRVYYDSFFLNAANTSRILRAKSGGKADSPAYVYLVHPWLVKLFFECNIIELFPHVNRSDALRCPTVAQKGTFKDALKSGDAVMHAFSHSSQPEVMDESTFLAALEMVIIAKSHGHFRNGIHNGVNVWNIKLPLKMLLFFQVADTATDLGVRSPRVLSQRDVPGLARSAIPLLAKHDVIGISVGANDGSPPPLV